MHGQKGVGRLCYQGRGSQFPNGWLGISGAWRGLTEDDGPCVVTELGLGRGVRGEQHIEEPEGGGWGEQQPQQQQDPLPRGAGRPHSSPSAWCPVKRSWAGLIWSGGGRGPRASGRDSLANGTGQWLPERGIVSGSRLWAWIQFRLLPPCQGKQSWGSGRPRSTQCFIEKSQASAGWFHSTWLGGGPRPQELSQIFLQAGWAGRIPPSSPFPSSLMVTSKQ